MTETQYIQRLHRKLPSEVFRWKIRAAFSNGVPDCWYSASGGDLWAEYKYVKNTPQRGFTVALSPLQRKWLCDRHTEGRNVAVIIGCPSGSVILTDLAWTQQKQKAPSYWLSDSEVIEWLLQRLASSSSSMH